MKFPWTRGDDGLTDRERKRMAREYIRKMTPTREQIREGRARLESKRDGWYEGWDAREGGSPRRDPFTWRGGNS